jgi:hypothetical protein
VQIKKMIAGNFATPNHYPACISSTSNSTAIAYSDEYLKGIAKFCEETDFVVDKMPDNFLRIGLIKILFPNAKIIHSKRNTLDICTSIFKNYFATGHKYSFDLKDVGNYYLEYSSLMTHSNKLFPADIYELQYEKLVVDQETTSKKLIEYLDLQWNEKCLDFHNSNRVVKTASNLQIRKPMYSSSVTQWKLYEKHLQPLLEHDVKLISICPVIEANAICVEIWWREM